MAKGFTFTTNINDFKKIQKNLEYIQGKIQRGAARGAMSKAATPTLKKAKELAPRASGLLRRSLKKKISTSVRKNTVSVVIGPDKNVKEPKRLKDGSPALDKLGRPVFVSPVRYAHAVEFGHGGPAPAPPHPFLRPALDATEALARAIYKREILIEIDRYAKKFAKA